MSISKSPKSDKYTATQKLLTYCLAQFKSSVSNNELTLPKTWGQFSAEELNFYKFPNDINALLPFVNNSKTLLQDYGWFEPNMQGKVFTPWFKSSGIQFCVIDVKSWTFTKPLKGLNRDIPYLFKKINYINNKALPIVITSDPINASMLNAHDIQCIALDSYHPLKNQLKYLGQFTNPLVYLEEKSKKGEQTAEITTLALSKFTNLSILLIDEPVRDFAIRGNVDLAMAQNSISFLANRIMNKNNGKSAYERNIEIVEASIQIGESNVREFYRFAKLEGAVGYAHYAHSLRLMADLIDAKVSIENARDTVFARYGITIMLHEKNKAKVI
jgi:hypothetical protein